MGNRGKSELRRHLHHARAQLTGDERATVEHEVGCLLRQRVKRGCRIDVYWPMGSELRLDGFIRTAQKRGAKLYLSYIEPRSRRVWFTPYPTDGVKQEREHGRTELHVPQFTERRTRVHGLSILLVPIVSIDREDYHLGQAGGYYGATLPTMKYRLQARTIDVGFAYQLVDRLPHEAHDVPLDGFVSERGALAFRRSRQPVHRGTSWPDSTTNPPSLSTTPASNH